MFTLQSFFSSLFDQSVGNATHTDSSYIPAPLQSDQLVTSCFYTAICPQSTGKKESRVLLLGSKISLHVDGISLCPFFYNFQCDMEMSLHVTLEIVEKCRCKQRNSS